MDGFNIPIAIYALRWAMNFQTITAKSADEWSLLIIFTASIYDVLFPFLPFNSSKILASMLPTLASAPWPWSQTSLSASERRLETRLRWLSSIWLIQRIPSEGLSPQIQPSWTPPVKLLLWKVGYCCRNKWMKHSVSLQLFCLLIPEDGCWVTYDVADFNIMHYIRKWKGGEFPYCPTRLQCSKFAPFSISQLPILESILFNNGNNTSLPSDWQFLHGLTCAKYPYEQHPCLP